MKRKENLEKKLARLNAKKESLKQRALASNDQEKVEDMKERILDIDAEITEVQEEISAIDEEERSLPTSDEYFNAKPPLGAELRTSNTVGSFKMAQADERSSNILESTEYRQAFRDLWVNKKPIPAELLARARSYVNSLPEEQRAGTPINTSNTAAVIPLTIMRQVINTVRTPFGNIYDRVRKTNVAGAVEYPIGEFEADFHWVTEGTVSPEQEIGAVGVVSFGYFEAELRIAQTFLSSLLSLDAFEAEISTVIARAYRKFMDNAIINGDGKGKITGLEAGTTKTVTMTATQFNNWTQWEKRFFAELVPGYEDGIFVFARSTVVKYLKTMADANNRPIFYDATGLTVGDGDAAVDKGYFYGREILMTVPTIVKDFDTASQGDTVGYFFQPDYYVLNENWGFTVDRYYNYERRKWITVATVVVDGKPLNPTGFIKIVKA